MDMFEGDDFAVAACAAKVLARAGPGMAKHCQARKLELPQQVRPRSIRVLSVAADANKVVAGALLSAHVVYWVFKCCTGVRL